MVRTRLKLAATLTVVVLALTGFQTSVNGKGGSGKSGKSRSSGDGGGCSSSEKKNDDYDYEGGTSGDSGNGSSYTPSPTSSPTSDVEVLVVDCVEPAQKKRKGKPARKADTTATLKITSRSAYPKTYKVVLEFKGTGGSAVDRAETVVSVDGNASKSFDVRMRKPKAVGQVKDCYVYDVRELEPTTPAPSTPSAPGATASAS
ncbi:hypothetical protein ABZ135_18785 [Streptomyces sp. NPDC006339]|uniref:hypothetical protein n=1 Tax=Streptomyces sp. NPDC006339 TaxID=3156755 RepID=UPI0033BCABBA